jgi:hypothetical protein
MNNMCNPRRIRVRASRTLTDTWERQVRRVVGRQGRVAADARVTESLAATIGAPALMALASVLDTAEGWERDGDVYRFDLDGGHVLIDTGSWELQIVASAEADVEVVADATVAVLSEISERVDAEGTASYYTDGYGGHTRERALELAREEAQRAVEEEFGTRVASARARAEAEGTARAEAEAAEQADRRLSEASAVRHEELRREAERRLTLIGAQGRGAFNQVLGQAYRDSILAYARARGAERISCSEESGVLDIEFEIPA